MRLHIYVGVNSGKVSLALFRVKIFAFYLMHCPNWPCVSVYVKSRLKRRNARNSFRVLDNIWSQVCLLKAVFDMGWLKTG